MMDFDQQDKFERWMTEATEYLATLPADEVEALRLIRARRWDEVPQETAETLVHKKLCFLAEDGKPRMTFFSGVAWQQYETGMTTVTRPARTGRATFFQLLWERLTALKEDEAVRFRADSPGIPKSMLYGGRFALDTKSHITERLRRNLKASGKRLLHSWGPDKQWLDLWLEKRPPDVGSSVVSQE